MLVFDLASELQFQKLLKVFVITPDHSDMAAITELQGFMRMIWDYLKTGAVSREIEYGFKKD